MARRRRRWRPAHAPIYGARPLKRVIQKRLVDKLALKLLEGEFGPEIGGGSTRAAGSSHSRE